MIGLPKEFACFGEGSKGGGVIQVGPSNAKCPKKVQSESCLQGSASDCVLVSLLAARYAAIKALKIKHPDQEDGVLLCKLMAYCSKEVGVV